MEDIGDFSLRFEDEDLSDLDEESLDSLVNSVKPKSTKNATKWGMNVFWKWLEKRGRQMDFNDVSEEELATTLRKFYAEVKRPGGEPYTPSALTGIRAAIHRYITGPPFNRSVNILAGESFTAANTMFTTKCKKYIADGNAKPKHKSAISESDMTKLSEYFSNHTTEPSKLVEYVWFTLCYFFGRRGREKWRELKIGFYRVQQDAEGKEYITESLTEQTKNHQGGNQQRDQDYSDNHLYTAAAVNAFKLYCQKRNKEVEVLFQTPLKKCAISGALWYKAEALGKNTLGNMMQTISKKAGLSQIYTCHCVRASMITILYQAGVSPKEICAVTKHRSESSLAPYIGGLSKKQKTNMDDILSAALGSEVKTHSK